MAKKAAAIGIGLALGLGAYLFATSASAAGGDDDNDLPDEPPEPGDPPTPGNGPGGSPKPVGGGKTYGEPAGVATYTIPDDWDPVRGLFISPDCEMVVEAPGWFCGSGENDTPQVFGGFACTAIEFDSYHETMAEPGNGVAGYVEFLIGLGSQPEQIAFTILTEVSPLCADLPDAQWPPGLVAWYEAFLERVIFTWEEYWGIEFDPLEANVG